MKKALKRMTAAALLTLALWLPEGLFAQNTVVGRVVDTNDVPLIGVNVVVKGTTTGTTTGTDGNYTIKVGENQTLIFSYLGYTTVEQPVGKRTAINVKMTEEATQLGAVEIVNIGYGTTTRRDLTGSVAKADLGTMMKANVTNFDQALSGRIAGVVVTTGDGSLGSEATITIRGNNSLTQSNAPLYIIDGKESSFDPGLTTNSVESIQLLKPEEATAKYGERGKYGAVEITTTAIYNLKHPKTASAEEAPAGQQPTPSASEDDTPFLVAEEMPLFQGKDLNTFRSWLQSQIRYPAEALKRGIEASLVYFPSGEFL